MIFSEDVVDASKKIESYQNGYARGVEIATMETDEYDESKI